MEFLGRPSLPRLCAGRHAFGLVAADAAAAPWPQIPAVDLLDVVTGERPAQATRLRLAWDEAGLRVLFEATDAHPWATLTKRDAPLYTEEVVEVFLDPAGDLIGYFEIEVNPLNAVLDLVIRRQRRGLMKDFRWQCEGLRTAAARTASGWTAELSIPFASIAPAAPEPGALWRANFCRIDRPEGRPRELSAWSPTGAALFHVPERFGVVEFGE